MKCKPPRIPPGPAWFFRALLVLGICVFRAPAPAPAQDAGTGEAALDWDFDSLFDEEASEEVPAADSDSGEAASLLADLLGRSGFSLDLSYSANAGFSPGWSEAPWFAAEYEGEYSHVLGLNLNSYLTMDMRVSDTFRVHSSFSWTVPGSTPLSLPEFFIDYQIKNLVYFRVGKFNQNWGISPNFSAANLLSRVPPGKGGDPYLLKMDIPIGIGGLQFLALTRSGFMQGTTPAFREIGYGGKYNLAFTWADIDLAAFYHKEMPLRASASLKTTLWDTELYLETLGTVHHENWDGYTFSANLGFARSFLNDLISFNGELFWNGEDNAYYFRPGTELVNQATPSFIPGLNAAWNLIYRPRWIWNLRFALTGRWALDTNTAYILPGLSFAPLPHLEVSLGFPTALGGQEGRYYSKSHAAATGLPYADNADKDGRPFGIALLINLKGAYRLDR